MARGALQVKFPSGLTIQKGTSAATMVAAINEAIKIMGRAQVLDALEKIDWCNSTLGSANPYYQVGTRYDRNVKECDDGIYVNTCSNDKDKKRKLDEFSDILGIKLDVSIVKSPPTNTSAGNRQNIQEKEKEEVRRRIQELWGKPEGPSVSELTQSIELLTHKSCPKEKTIKELEKILSDVIYNNYDIDFDEIIKRITEENKRNFYLWFDYNKRKSTKEPFIKFDIYVSETAKLNLTAIHKAVYLAFLLSEDGEYLQELSFTFFKVLKEIYKQLPDKVMDEKNGIVQKDFDSKTLNGYRTEIRNAIKKHISNNNIVNEFAIEGYKGQLFKIQRSTIGIRNKIVKLFGLQEIIS